MAVLIVAFVLSAWGNMIAASFCPRYALNHECCAKHIVSQPKEVMTSSCQHEMAGMEMDDMQMENESAQDSSTDSTAQSSKADVAPESSNDLVAFDLPLEECAHCWSHSQATLGNVSVIAVDPPKQLVDTSSPRADSQFGLSSVSPVSISPTEHSPPGFALPRHVLINVFRI